MKNISLLFRADFHHVTRNVIAIVVLFGVVVIPSFFGWFNVLSSWDPFGNVKNLKVAVANADEGYRSDLFPMPINIGEQVISNLRANSDLEWEFTSESEAIEGTKSGEYYAALVLPKNFSKEMMTFLAPGAKPAEIEYYSNEKKNALSPKITGEAATEVSTQINETFTKTLNEVGLSVISTLAKNAGSPDAQATFLRLEASVRATSAGLTSGANTLDMFSALIGSSKTMVGSAESLASASGDAVRKGSGALGQGVNAAQSLESILQSATASISSALSQTSSTYQDLINQVDQLDTSFGQQSQTASDALGTMSTDIGVQISQYQSLRDELRSQAQETTDTALRHALELVVAQLDGVIDRQTALQNRIDQAAATLAGTNSGLGTMRDEIVGLVNEAKDAVDRSRVSYDQNLRPKLDGLVSTLSSINSDMGAIGSELADASAALSGGSSSLLDSLTAAETTTASIAKDLRLAADRFSALSPALQLASDTGDFTEVQKLIGSNPEILASELTSPVGLNRIPVYKVDTFGAQMAPFYTVLGLWVGALLLAVVIRTDVAPGMLAPAGPLTKAQEYLGRYGVFALLGFLQSSLLYLGLMGFVGVRPAHPMLLLLAGWVMSLVFTLITYTLVLSFGEAGKATAVFLLVVQISAGGGAYPLSVLPQWFQSVSPWLPVTHATNAIRSAIAGVYDGDYWVSLGQLALFLIPALLIGLVLRLPVLKLNTSLSRALESTKLM